VINLAQVPRDVIVIGASAGGVEALTSLFAKLPRGLPAATAVVIHRSPVFETQLPLVLGRRSGLSVLEPEDSAPFEPGRIYIAPRDRHMIIQSGLIRLSGGPKEHRTRPAIDPLFVSAAREYGPRVVGVLLSGFGADGVSGLIQIKKVGGMSLVQHPGEARAGAMPRNAIAEDDVDAVLVLDQMAECLVALSAGEPCEPSEGQRAAS
jgi:two-component system chemotaxis response regulator CheB